MATNHGVGGSNPSSPTTGKKGKDSWGQKINYDLASGSKAMELRYRYFRIVLPFLKKNKKSNKDKINYEYYIYFIFINSSFW